MLAEAERSLHDALCVIRCLIKKGALLPGGGAPEIELALKLATYAQKLEGVDAYCVRAFANALEVRFYFFITNVINFTSTKSKHFLILANVLISGHTVNIG